MPYFISYNVYACQLICLVIYLFSGFNFYGSCERDEDDPGWRIVNGNPVAEGEYTFVVSIQTNAKKHTCGGTLINEKTVLTACHCLAIVNITGHYMFDPKKFIVVAGVIDIVDSGEGYQNRKVKIFSVHAKCSKPDTGIAYDGGIAILQAPFSLNKYVSIGILPEIHEGALSDEVDEMIEERHSCTIVGWGSTFAEGPSTKILQAGKVTLSTTKACTEAFSFMSLISVLSFNPKCMMCSIVSPLGADTCRGDSGGPLVCNGKIIGITSWGIECATEGMPSIFTRVDVMLDFINVEMLKNHTTNSYYSNLYLIIFGSICIFLFAS